ncbi:unnamed protein product [Moneuplotes crassus]|uniref:Uncharacterized protein n=1 Tax=Euplotes crassus TaxID=5936 RepID=A0AAD1XEK5_EUPCR|nr:unnamed protein product [Moneuplotes crassus]
MTVFCFRTHCGWLGCSISRGCTFRSSKYYGSLRLNNASVSTRTCSFLCRLCCMSDNFSEVYGVNKVEFVEFFCIIFRLFKQRYVQQLIVYFFREFFSIRRELVWKAKQRLCELEHFQLDFSYPMLIADYQD